MSPKFPLFIGLRYLRSKQSNSFASLISIFSFVAMVLGVIALIVVLSVMNGFNQEIRERILNVIPHGSLELSIATQDWRLDVEQVESVKGVTGAAPLVDGYGLLSSNGRNKGVSVQGIDPAYEVDITAADQYMLMGRLTDLQPGTFGIVLGSQLARSLGVVRGNVVMLSLPHLNVTPLGVFPRFKRFQVVGVYKVGAQVDDGIAFIHYEDAQKIYRKEMSVKAIRFRVNDPLAMNSTLSELSRLFSKNVKITTWEQQLNSLFQAIKTEKAVVGILLSAIIAVAAFNIIASLVLLVTDKRKDIAVLKTQGADAMDIFKIFVIQGSAIGGFGVLTGVILGSTLAYFIGDIVLFLEEHMGFYVFDPDVYFISKLPSQIFWQDIAIVSCLGLLLSVIATLYPAFRASQVLPAEALRYDH